MDTGYVNADGEQFELVNLSGMSTEVLEGDKNLREVARRLRTWRQNQVGDVSARKGHGLFARGKYVASDNPYDQMAVAEAAAKDDVVASVLETTEGLTLQSVAWESTEEDLASVLNQVNTDLKLDAYLRIAWRELEMYNQSVTATIWGWKDYLPQTMQPTDRTRKDGKRVQVPKRKSMRLYVPIKIITLDPQKIVPVGLSVFGEDRLAWHAATEELGVFDGGRLDLDPVMLQLMLGRYKPGMDEAQGLTELGVDITRLLELDPARVWRVTLGRPSYRHFADVRMETIFRILDMKQQLWASDRVALVGNADYILLVRQGSDPLPATGAEIQTLQQNFRTIAQLPVIVADHRLQVDIITPSTDHTLDRDRYDLLDERILSRMLGSLSVSQAQGDVDVQVRARSIARALESRRLVLRREVEDHFLGAIWDHPRNRETLSAFRQSARPSLAFSPRNIQVDNDAIMQQIRQAARQAGEISRRTFLESLGEDLEVEAQRLDYEERVYPDWKQAVPFNSPANSGNSNPANGGGDPQGGEPSAVSGARGGRPVGGGGQKKNSQAKPRTTSGNPSA